jgi:hypothetical protein
VCVSPFILQVLGLFFGILRATFRTRLPARYHMILILPSTQSSDAVSRIFFQKCQEFPATSLRSFETLIVLVTFTFCLSSRLRIRNCFFFFDVAPCSLVDWHWSVGEIYLPTYTASEPRIRQSYSQTSHHIQAHSQFAADAILFHFVLHLLGLPQDLSADRAAGTEGTAANSGRTHSGS